jgi:hypothetical protein
MAASHDTRRTENPQSLVFTRGSVDAARLVRRAARILSKLRRWAAAGGWTAAESRTIAFSPPLKPREGAFRRIVIPDYSDLAQPPWPRDPE